VQKIEQEFTKTLSDLQEEMDRSSAKAEKERNQLINEVACTQKERDDGLVMAQNEKQEEMRIAAKEKALLMEIVKQKDEEIEELALKLEKLRKDATSKTAQDKVRDIQARTSKWFTIKCTCILSAL